MTYAELLQTLLRFNLVEKRTLAPPTRVFPQGYDTSKQCEFHSGAFGHDIEGCHAFKHNVQDLIDSHDIEFTPSGVAVHIAPVSVDAKMTDVSKAAVGQKRILDSMVSESPGPQLLPIPGADLRKKMVKHKEGVNQYIEGQETNVAFDTKGVQGSTRYQQQQPQQGAQQAQRRFQGSKPRRVFEKPPSTYAELLQTLLGLNLVEKRTLAPITGAPPFGYDANRHCEFHSGAPGHDIEGCHAFKHKVQDLLDSAAISFGPRGSQII